MTGWQAVFNGVPHCLATSGASLEVLLNVSRRYHLLRVLSCIGCWLLTNPSSHGNSARSRAVELSANVQLSPPAITLLWTSATDPVASQTISRRVWGDSSWGTPVSVPATATTWIDSSVTIGTAYEYRVIRTYVGNSPWAGYGYILSGIQVPVTDSRGTALLVVDTGIATALSSELTRFTSDLEGDGWRTLRLDVSASATPASVRAAIQALHVGPSGPLSAAILIGNIPTLRSGNYLPDGHSARPFPADSYYADMNGVWTDDQVNAPGANIPGDGILDPKSLTETGDSFAELQVGRIDFSAMPEWEVSEVALLQRYFDRNHAFRHSQGAFASVGRRGLVKDDFEYFNGEAFARVGYGTVAGLFGSAAGSLTVAGLFPSLETQSHLFVYGNGGGTTTYMAPVVSADFETQTNLGVFHVFFGSYFVDWDTPDNLLRAPLAGTDESLALTSCWGNRPAWYFHPMAVGHTIGRCAQLAQSYSPDPTTGYYSSNEYIDGYPDMLVPGGVHMALMGDPTLRLHTVAPPTDLTAVVAGSGVSLTWSASVDPAVIGYHIYRRAGTGNYEKLSATPVTDVAFVDTEPVTANDNDYQVKAVKLETSGSGTYFNTSQAEVTQVAVPPTPIQVWRQTHFGTMDNAGTAADDANLDGDRFSNLVEYAVGLNPTTADPTGAIQTGLTMQTVDDEAKPYLTITFTRDATRSDVGIEVVASGDLSDWNSLATCSGDPVPTGPGFISESSGDIRTVTVRDTIPVSDQTRRFITLQITLQ